MRSILICIPLIAAATLEASAAPDPRDESTFTAFVAEAIRKEIPTATVTVKQEARTIEVKNGAKSLKVSLDNLASDCALDQRDCDKAISNFTSIVKVAALQDHTAPVNKADLRIVVRPKQYVDELRKGTGSGGSGPIAGSIAGDVWFVCVVDEPRNIISLSEERAKSIGLSRDEAISQAKKNLAAALQPLASVVKDLPENGIGYLDGDFYQSSRLSLHDEWDALATKYNGNLLVAVPASDLLIYANGSNERQIDAVATLAENAFKKSPRPISATVFRWTKSGWEVVKQQ